MHAIILAAGRGSRLADYNPDGKPKCLMEFGGSSLLERHLGLLYDNGIRQTDIVVGCGAERISDHIAHIRSRPDVAFHFNPRFEHGSVISLWAAEDTLKSGNDVLLMDADVLYHPGILSRLVHSQQKNCYLLDREFDDGEEPVKIAVRDGQMVDFRKQLDKNLQYDYLGESVGFFSLRAYCRKQDCAGVRTIRAGRTFRCPT